MALAPQPNHARWSLMVGDRGGRVVVAANEDEWGEVVHYRTNSSIFLTAVKPL